MVKNLENILRVLPREIAASIEQEKIEEIRLRANKNIILKYIDKEVVTDYIVSTKDLLTCLQIFCDNSIYSYQSQICNGFVTIVGGHRVGITGTCVIENGNIINIKNISSLNFRIARQIKGCSMRILKDVIDKENKNIFTTLIVSPPRKRENHNATRSSQSY